MGGEQTQAITANLHSVERVHRNVVGAGHHLGEIRVEHSGYAGLPPKTDEDGDVAEHP